MAAHANNFLSSNIVMKLKKDLRAESQPDIQQQRTVSTTYKRKLRIQRSRGKDQQYQSQSNCSLQRKSRSRKSTTQYNWNLDQKQLRQIANNTKIQRKRQPTPCKSQRQINLYAQKKIQNEQSIMKKIQKDAQICSLQKQLEESRDIEVSLKNKLNMFEDKYKNVSAFLKATELKQKTLQIKNKEIEATNVSLQKNIMEFQLNLSTANSNIQQLQRTIKSNQISSFKTKIQMLEDQLKKSEEQKSKIQGILAKMQEEIINIDVKYQKLEVQYKQLEYSTKSSVFREEYLEGEIKFLRQKLTKLNPTIEELRVQMRTNESTPSPLLKSKNSFMRQGQIPHNHSPHPYQDFGLIEILTSKLKEQEGQISKLKCSRDKLQIQLNCRQRKDVQKHQVYIQNKEETINTFRKRLAKTLNQLSTLKIEIKKQKSKKPQKNNPLIITNYGRSSQNRLNKTHDNNENKFIQNRAIRQSILSSNHSRCIKIDNDDNQSEISLQLSQ